VCLIPESGSAGSDKQRGHSKREKLKKSKGMKNVESICKVRETGGQVGAYWQQRRVRLEAQHSRTDWIFCVLI
jgi:hypothetical protein